MLGVIDNVIGYQSCHYQGQTLFQNMCKVGCYWLLSLWLWHHVKMHLSIAKVILFVFRFKELGFFRHFHVAMWNTVHSELNLQQFVAWYTPHMYALKSVISVYVINIRVSGAIRSSPEFKCLYHRYIFIEYLFMGCWPFCR